MRSRRIAGLALTVSVLGTLDLLAGASEARAEEGGGAVLCGPVCYVVCPAFYQLEADCQAQAFNCHTASNCGVANCDPDGYTVESDCGWGGN